MKRLVPSAVVVALLSVMLAGPANAAKTGAPAATVVTDCAESGLDAALAGGGTITFNCGGPTTIHLSSAKTITKDTSLDGGDTITLAPSIPTRFFVVAPGANFALEHIVLDSATALGSDGGAIANHGALTLDHTTIQRSQTDSNHSGGAIFSDGPVTLTSSLLISNTGGSAGALFANFGNAIVHISNSTLDGNHTVNTTTGYGGAIWLGKNAQLTISGGTVSSNTAQYGGGLYVDQGATVTVNSTGAPALLSGNAASFAGGGLYNSLGLVALTNADLENNSAVNADRHVTTFGGGIDAFQATTMVQASMLMSNTANDGAGIFVVSGTLTLTDTLLEGNIASGAGGGIESNPAGRVSLIGSSVSHNAAGTGGGIDLLNGSALQVVGGAITDNQASFGGGIANGNSSTAALTGTVVSGNEAKSSGGGIYTAKGAVRLTAVTLNDNRSGDTGGGIATSQSTLTVTNATLSDNLAKIGGGLFSDDSAARLTNATLAGNLASQQGASIYATAIPIITAPGMPTTPPMAVVTLTNTLLAGGALVGNCAGDNFISAGYNLSSDGTCAAFLTQPGDLNSTNPHLGPLASNGGPTLTHLPAAGSPAIDAIPLNTNGCGTSLTTDQRGFARPFNVKCDMGSVEAGWVFPQLWLPLARR